jgi:hypothetical protein
LSKGKLKKEACFNASQFSFPPRHSTHDSHQLGDKLTSFISKLELWQRKMKCEILGIFPSLKQFINSDNKCEKLIS